MQFPINLMCLHRMRRTLKRDKKKKLREERERERERENEVHQVKLGFRR